MAVYQTSYGLSSYDSGLLTSSPALAAYFEACASHTAHPKQLTNLFTGELFRLLPADITAKDLTAEPAHIGYVATLLGEGKLNSTTAKKLFLAVWQEGANPAELMKRENLSRITNQDALAAVVEAVLRENPSMVSSYLGGKQTAFKALMGACMAATKGQADPILLQKLLLQGL
jgi:aspartyl-tRNA(Asn)/glutamyl-tRNA(Gln) amidotransferase subunit B